MRNGIGKALVGLIIVGVVSYLAWDSTNSSTSTLPLVPERNLQYLTTSTRTANVEKYCSGRSRTGLASTSDQQNAKQNRDQVDSELGIDGNKLIFELSSGNMGDAASQITSNIVGLALFVGVFLVGLIVFLWVWPFLCCCCCCPSCCPSKCCQKAEDQQYSKCQLYWPMVTLVLACLLCISASIYGFINTTSVGSSIGDLACAIAIVPDDIINGNVTSDGASFFTGLTQFSNQLSNLQSNLTYMQTQFNDLANLAAGTTYGYANAVMTVRDDISYIPKGSSTTGKMTLDYANPINTGGSGTYTSSFVDKLGEHSDTSSLVGAYYTVIDTAYYDMLTIKASANVFNSQVPTITAEIPSIQSTVDSLKTDMQDLESNAVGKMLDGFGPAEDYSQLVLQAFYGYLIGFSFLAMIGALLTACCGKYGCRHLMYFSCIFLMLGCLFCFIIAFFLSISVPLFTWTCDWLDTTVSTQAGYNTNMGAFMDASSVNQTSVCMPFGNGNLVSEVGGTATNGINNLTALIENMAAYNSTQQQNWINSNVTNFITEVRQYCKGQISDLDSTNNDVLSNLASSNANFGTGCTGLAADSWVPSNSQDTSKSTYIACQVSSGEVGDKTTCTSTLTDNGGNTCGGCMDSTMLMTYYSSAATLTSDLDSRYTGGCVFTTEMTNIWTNYYSVKNTKLGPDDAAGTGSVLARSEQAVSDTNSTGASSVFTNLDNMNTYVDGVQTNIASISTLTDPNYGMLVGLNCRVFGEDFVQFQAVICGKFYSNMYNLRLTIGIAAFGMLFSLCCIVCTGVRHFKHMEREKKVGDAFFRNQDGSSRDELKQKRRNKY